MMTARGNSGAPGNGGSISLRFDCKRSTCSVARSVCSGADSYILETWKAECPSFYRARGNGVSPALVCAVLIEYARAGALSNAMKWTRRRCSWSSCVKRDED